MLDAKKSTFSGCFWEEMGGLPLIKFEYSIGKIEGEREGWRRDLAERMEKRFMIILRRWDLNEIEYTNYLDFDRLSTCLKITAQSINIICNQLTS